MWKSERASRVDQELITGQVLISQYNSLGDGRYHDTASQTSFEVDHASQVSTPRVLGKALLTQL